jgi:hypothetical protein
LALLRLSLLWLSLLWLSLLWLPLLWLSLLRLSLLGCRLCLGGFGQTLLPLCKLLGLLGEILRSFGLAL